MSVLIAALLIFFFVRNKNDQTKSITVSPSQSVQTTTEDKIKIEQQNLANDRVLDAALDKFRQVDKDLDGLSDEEEKKLGSDPNNPDTDGDGLLDGDEVKFYKSDPIKADTDGDSFKDGYEVRGGYSPIGSGKLKK